MGREDVLRIDASRGADPVMLTQGVCSRRNLNAVAVYSRELSESLPRAPPLFPPLSKDKTDLALLSPLSLPPVATSDELYEAQ